MSEQAGRRTARATDLVAEPEDVELAADSVDELVRRLTLIPLDEPPPSAGE